MKFLYFNFFLFSLFAGFSVGIFSQQPTVAKQNEDWSALFPEIPNCERNIQPITRNSEVFEQTATYEPKNYKYDVNQGYFGCGSITLRFAPSARKWALENYSNVANFPMTQKLQIKNFDAYRNSPMCGNDEWIGSTEIYFDKDKVLFLSAYVGAYAIWEFAETADYKSMRKSINQLVKSKAKR